MNTIDVFEIDFEAMERIYTNAVAERDHYRFLEAQAERCQTGKCDHDRFFRDGRPAINKDGTPNRNGRCKEGIAYYDASLRGSCGYSNMNILDFFKAIGVDDHE